MDFNTEIKHLYQIIGSNFYFKLNIIYLYDCVYKLSLSIVLCFTKTQFKTLIFALNSTFNNLNKPNRNREYTTLLKITSTTYIGYIYTHMLIIKSTYKRNNSTNSKTLLFCCWCKVLNLESM